MVGHNGGKILWYVSPSCRRGSAFQAKRYKEKRQRPDFGAA